MNRIPTFQDVIKQFKKPNIQFFAWVSIFVFLVLVNLDLLDSKFGLHDILVEFHGIIFDLFIFGILIAVYQELRADSEKIERLHEEIDDYRGWKEKEAMYRIVGAIKRLNRLGISKINLNGCFLKEADLRGVNLNGATLVFADLSGSLLQNSDLRKADLQCTQLQACKFQGAQLQEADLRRANINFTDFQGANIQGANFEETILSYVSTHWDTEGRNYMRGKYKYEYGKIILK